MENEASKAVKALQTDSDREADKPKPEYPRPDNLKLDHGETAMMMVLDGSLQLLELQKELLPLLELAGARQAAGN